MSLKIECIHIFPHNMIEKHGKGTTFNFRGSWGLKLVSGVAQQCRQHLSSIWTALTSYWHDVLLLKLSHQTIKRNSPSLYCIFYPVLSPEPYPPGPLLALVLLFDVRSVPPVASSYDHTYETRRVPSHLNI